MGVRDNASLDVAKSIAPHANVHKTFDLAPLLLSSENYIQKKTDRKGIALTLCSVAIDAMGNTDSDQEKQRFDQLAQLITSLYLRTGEPITLIEFNGHSVLGDWHINNSILKRLHSSIPVTIKYYEPNPMTVLDDLSGYKAILSMRLHGSILGYLANTPVFSINYHRKCKGWCDDINMPEDYQIDLFNLNVKNIVKNISQGITKGFQQSTLAVESALNNSLSNWSI